MGGEADPGEVESGEASGSLGREEDGGVERRGGRGGSGGKRVREGVAGKESGRQRREKMRGGAVLSVDPSHSRAAIRDGERNE